MRIFFISLFTGCFFYFGCAPALPERNPEGVTHETISSAAVSASSAQASAVEARLHAERGEKLIEEARAILKRAEEVERSCAATKQILEKKRQAALRKPHNPKNEGENAKAGTSPQNPEWSKSDGPF